MPEIITKTIRGVQCTHCGDRIWSRHRHDCRSCTCGKSFVDGGRDYLRSGGDPLPNPVDIEVEFELRPKTQADRDQEILGMLAALEGGEDA